MHGGDGSQGYQGYRNRLSDRGQGHGGDDVGDDGVDDVGDDGVDESDDGSRDGVDGSRDGSDDGSSDGGEDDDGDDGGDDGGGDNWAEPHDLFRTIAARLREDHLRRLAAHFGDDAIITPFPFHGPQSNANPANAILEPQPTRDRRQSLRRLRDATDANLGPLPRRRSRSLSPRRGSPQPTGDHDGRLHFQEYLAYQATRSRRGGSSR